MIARVAGVDRDDRQVAQILAVILAERQLGRTLRFLNRLWREGVGDAVLVDRDQAERLGGERIAQDIGNLDARARTASGRLRQHQLPGLGPAQIGNRLRMTFALVDRGKPALPGSVNFHHAHHLFGASGELFHRVSDPARGGFLGPGQDAIPHAQRGLLTLFDQTQPRGWNVLFRLPAVGNGQRLTILGSHHAQYGHLGNTAHAVESRAVAVNQTLFGHVLEQRLELNLFLPFQAKGAGNLPLAGRLFAVGDEIQDLLAAWQAGLRLGAFHQVNKPGRRRCVPPPVRP